MPAEDKHCDHCPLGPYERPTLGLRRSQPWNMKMLSSCTPELNMCKKTYTVVRQRQASQLVMCPVNSCCQATSLAASLLVEAMELHSDVNPRRGGYRQQQQRLQHIQHQDQRPDASGESSGGNLASEMVIFVKMKTILEKKTT